MRFPEYFRELYARKTDLNVVLFYDVSDVDDTGRYDLIKGQLQTRAVLLARVWGPLAEVEDANLDCYIHFVRRRLKAVGSAVTITTVRGSGYKAEVPPC